MILYNVTVKVEAAIAEDWLLWMQEKHIPDVMKTGLFVEHKLLRMLSHQTDEDPTFCVQYFLESQEDFDSYQKEFAPALQKEHIDRFGERAMAFRTILETV